MGQLTITLRNQYAMDASLDAILAVDAKELRYAA